MINKNIQEYRDLFSEELNKLQEMKGPSYLYDPIKYIIKSEGKRLRPLIVQYLGDVFNTDSKDTMNGAMGVELLHNFTLVHDDIMDGDDLRHNVPTIHKKWDNAHAVLSGDGLGALGPIFIGKIKKNTLDILIRYNEVILEICEGQAYDMEFESRDASVNDYILMSEKKTGSLFELCFEIPALISDDYIQFKSELKTFGRNLGVIFQIQDDILEMSTSSENMGKGIDSDIQRGKKTILSSIALDSDKSEWNNVQEKIENTSLEEKKIILRNYYRDADIIKKADKLLLNFENKCKNIIKSLPNTIHNDMTILLNMILKRKK
ncbi:MAG: polyprenyl synthetase family protein [Candidatus Marinimicrobia bacterium]|nr:polyprenyl synthetase family protein [Candidatus Neomarinimicrobiota bacterium]MBT3944606.1 polyprenyl synthetase family protein [Candidatus Neomarinimicrobiota bacterium]MBT4111635.1 polyprenyl synthetase family protein [Candidatus Neomarinimicrobiota bacterium]MBT4926584.1 polyprenyl synthetase family protein [Candidatus Neomarinimicrobiota bacterium]MBT5251273.1 polyprenyl synthetase family protein [Candidatus Neomarinimicrobiota bacterium]